MADAPVSVLLVEDDEDDYLLTRELFAELPQGAYLLERVADFERALARLDEGQHDVVLVDYRLGAHTGLELLAHAMTHGCTAPMIMLTGQREREVDLLAMQAGAVDYLVKDMLDAPQLDRAMRYAIQQRRAADAIRHANQQLEQHVRERTAELNEANAALRESEDRHRALLDSAGEGIYGVDCDGRCTFINRAAAAMLGYEPEELQGVKLHEIMRRHRAGLADDDGDSAIAKATREGREFRSSDEVFVRRDGAAFPVEYACFPLRGHDGLRGAVITFNDISLRKRSEEALRLSRERLNLVVKATEIGLWFCDLPLDRIDWNDTCRKHFGVSAKADATIDLLFERLHPDDREPVRQAMHRAINTGAEYDLSFRTRVAIGEERWIRAIGRRFCDDLGAPRRFDGVTIDVTAQKQSEQALAESQRFLRSVIDALPSQIAVLDDNGDIVAVNDAWRRFAEANQVAEQYALGQNYLELAEQGGGVHPPTSDIAEGIRAVMTGKIASFHTEYAAPTPHEPRWFQMRVSRFPRPGPLRVVVAHDNITARVISEQVLRRRSAQLQELAEIATHLNVAQGVEAALRIITEAARAVIGAHQCVTIQTVDQNWDNAISVVSLSPKYAHWRDYDARPEGSSVYAAICRSNQPRRLTQGELERDPAWRGFYLEAKNAPPLRGWLSAPLVGHDGRNLGIVHLSDKHDGDFTEEDESILVQLAQMASVAIENAFLYRNLREADQRKDRFLATLAHELRNPLSPLTAAAQIVAMEPDNASQVSELAHVMSRQLEQLKRLIDDLLDVSRITSGKMNLRREPVNLDEAIAAALDVSRPLIDDRGHALSISLPDDPLVVLGDKVRLAQIVSNLLINAAKYTPEKGSIEVDVRRESNKAVIRIRDNGIGIPREMLTKIFSLFTQVDSSNTRSQGGLGIGLTLVKTLLELQGGAIQAASGGAGRGSEFTVKLPLAGITENAPVEAPTRPTVEPLPRMRVLVVDDNQSASHLLSRLLERIGQQVRVAGSAESAFEQFTQFRPEVIISDIAMPGESGYALAARIRRSQLPQPTLIALTGYGQENDRQAALDAGFDQHLTKPVGISELRTLFHDILHRSDAAPSG